MANKKIRVKLIKGTNKKLRAHKACAVGLGLRKIGQLVEVEDSPQVRGMIKMISYLLEVEEV
jgi:ribosomal protein L30, bacterial/organelle